MLKDGKVRITRDGQEDTGSKDDKDLDKTKQPVIEELSSTVFQNNGQKVQEVIAEQKPAKPL